MTHELFDIWEEHSRESTHRAQMVGYVAHFGSEEQARKYVEMIKKERQRQADTIARRKK